MKRVNGRRRVLAWTCGLAAAAVLSIPGAGAARAQRGAEVDPADVQLAGQFADMAHRTLQQRTAIESAWREAMALYSAAHRLNPSDPRWPRHMADAAVRVGDAGAAIGGYKALLALEPTHRGAQVQLINLYLSRMQTADAQLAYLRDLMGKNAVPEDVRSVAAVKLAKLLLERSQRDEAVTALEQGLRLNPLNVEGLTLRYQLLLEKGTALERTGALLALVRANPIQPDALGAVARTLAQAGLVRDSLRWYEATLRVTQGTGRPISAALLGDYASALYVNGDAVNAQALLDKALAVDPSGLELWLVKLAIQKGQGEAGLNETVAKAGVAAFNQLAMLRQQVGVPGATTRPVELAEPLTLPDLSADLQAIGADESGQLRLAYANVLGEWAWLEVYFAERPDDAQKMIAALRSLLPEGDPVLSRLEGWSYLIKGSADEARVKLSAAADRDPLSAMGLIRLQAGESKDRAASEARKLLSENPAGLFGAILLSGLKGEGVQLVAGPQAEAIEEALSAFPKELLNLIDQPQSFYAVRVEPVKVAHGFAEPMNLRVTVQNLSEYDLTVGHDGVIKPDFSIDARQRGIGDQVFPLVASDQFTQVLVLKSRRSISQIVRLDQGQLGAFLMGKPMPSIQLGVRVVTNPAITNQGVVPTSGGYPVTMGRVIERSGSNALSEVGQQKVMAALSGNNGAEKIRAAYLISTYVRGIRGNPEAPENLRKAMNDFEQLIANAAADPSESVQAVAMYQRAAVQTDPAQAQAMLQRLAEEKAWQKQLLAAVALQALPPDEQKQAYANLAAEGRDPLVRQYAAARIDTLATAPPATQPATDPAAAPEEAEPLIP